MDNIVPQIMKSVAVAAIVFVLYMVVENIYVAYMNYGKSRIDVYPMTGNRTISFDQNPNNTANTKLLPVSENQLTGIEFSYSLFVYISEDTFDGSEGWKTIFYKGYKSNPFPLLGPGVFVSTGMGASTTTTGTTPTTTYNDTTNSPTLRIVMNSYDNWYNKLDIPQIPFKKWFHLAVVLRKNTLEAYVNGNLANKMTFKGTLPYQNYQPLNIFPTTKTSTDLTNSSATDGSKKRGIPAGDNFLVRGKMDGYISNLYYFPYAMSYSEIQSSISIGPSEQFDKSNMDVPPYLIDSWWTSRYTD
jgi:hypothetical protein